MKFLMTIRFDCFICFWSRYVCFLVLTLFFVNFCISNFVFPNLSNFFNSLHYHFLLIFLVCCSARVWPDCISGYVFFGFFSQNFKNWSRVAIRVSVGLGSALRIGPLEDLGRHAAGVCWSVRIWPELHIRVLSLNIS